MRRFSMFCSFCAAAAAAFAEPIRISPRDMGNAALDREAVTISGTVTEIFRDEIDPLWTFIFIERDGACAVVPLCEKAAPLAAEELNRLLDAEISATGEFHQNNPYGRKFLGPVVKVYGRENLAVTRPAPADPFAQPEIPRLSADRIDAALQTGHRVKISGTALAVWNRNTFLLAMENGQKLRIHPLPDVAAPAPGQTLEICGFLKPTPFFVHLSKAVCRKTGSARICQPGPVTDIVPSEVLTDAQGKSEIKLDFDGRLVRIRGRVVETVLAPTGESTTLLDADGERVKVIATGLSAPEPGSVIEATGVCVLTESVEDGRIGFPRLTGFTLVTRGPGDLRVVKNAPWWSPGKFLAVIGLLTALLAGALIWNRTLNRLVERRSRELVRKTLDAENAEARRSDRTRLAIELHDALSQNLAAVALQISSAKIARSRGNSRAEGNHLDTAGKMLDSSRTELKNCLYDLRSDMLEDRDFAEAVRKTIGNALGNARSEIDFAIRRSRLDDITAHAVLMVLRELVSNAVRHGKAGRIRIAGKIAENRLAFTVTDDGSGFSVTDAPGIVQGHFGLEGIRQRIVQLGGSVDISSTVGSGTTVTVAVPIPVPARTNPPRYRS